MQKLVMDKESPRRVLKCIYAITTKWLLHEKISNYLGIECRKLGYSIYLLTKKKKKGNREKVFIIATTTNLECNTPAVVLIHISTITRNFILVLVHSVFMTMSKNIFFKISGNVGKVITIDLARSTYKVIPVARCRREKERLTYQVFVAETLH